MLDASRNANPCEPFQEHTYSTNVSTQPRRMVPLGPSSSGRPLISSYATTLLELLHRGCLLVCLCPSQTVGISILGTTLLLWAQNLAQGLVGIGAQQISSKLKSLWSPYYVPSIMGSTEDWSFPQMCAREENQEWPTGLSSAKRGWTHEGFREGEEGVWGSSNRPVPWGWIGVLSGKALEWHSLVLGSARTSRRYIPFQLPNSAL